MASQKYHGGKTRILWAPTIDSAPTIDLSGSSRTIEVQESGNQIDVSTRDDFDEGGTSYLSSPPERTINLQGLDTTPDSSRTWNDIDVMDQGTVAVYPEGSAGTGKAFWQGNATVTNKNYSSPHDNGANYQLQFRVNGAWAQDVTGP